MTFDPNAHVIQLKSKQGSQDYLPVAWRIDQILDDPDLRLQRSAIAQTTLRLNDDPYASKYVARFLERVEVGEGGCWLWQSTLNNKGYARFGMYRRLVLVHRWAYLLIKGEIPRGLELDHLCTTPRCVNPDHLEPVTHLENNARGNSVSAKHKKKTHCPQGHPYNEENTSLNERGYRTCKVCKREKSRPHEQMLTLARTHCPQGHPYDEENTGIRKDGKRFCKRCSRIYTPTYRKNAAQQEAVH